MKKMGGMLAGMKTNSPSSSDKSTQTFMGHPSVNSGAMRGSVAPTPKTLGPRTA